MLFIPFKTYTLYVPLYENKIEEKRLKYCGSFKAIASYCYYCHGAKYKNKNRIIKHYIFENIWLGRVSYCSKCLKELSIKPEQMG